MKSERSMRILIASLVFSASIIATSARRAPRRLRHQAGSEKNAMGRKQTLNCRIRSSAWTLMLSLAARVFSSIAAILFFHLERPGPGTPGRLDR